MKEANAVHEEKETIAVDVLIPGHEERTTTALFERTRKARLATPGSDRCYICCRNHEEAGAPLHAHHSPVERSFANMIDWSPGSLIRRDFPQFDWVHFDQQQPMDPYLFVDDMRVNGMTLCAEHHIGKDEGIHLLPHPIWLAQRYGQDGYKFSEIEIIHHADQGPKQ